MSCQSKVMNSMLNTILIYLYLISCLSLMYYISYNKNEFLMQISFIYDYELKDKLKKLRDENDEPLDDEKEKNFLVNLVMVLMIVFSPLVWMGIWYQKNIK